MENLVLTFEGHIPAKKNRTRRVQRGGRVFTLPPKNWEVWHKKELLTLTNAPTIPSPVSLIYEWHIGGKDSPMLFDLSNSEESINDLLVDAGIIQDDSWQHVIERRGYVAGFVRGDGRCVVTIAHVPGVAWFDAVTVLKSDAELNRLKALTGMPKTKLRDKEWEILTA